MTRIGLISDTHGLLRPEALDFLAGAAYIVHAGDIGDAGILARLSAIAPLTVVRGNNDVGDWAASIAPRERLQIGRVQLLAVHDLADLRAEPPASDVQVVVSGHSHKPRVETRDGVLYVNPGSAGPRRFSLPISAGELLVDDDTGAITPRIVTLVPGAQR